MSTLMRSNLRSSSRHDATSTAGTGLAAQRQASTQQAEASAKRTGRNRDLSGIAFESPEKPEYASTGIAPCPADRSAPFGSTRPQLQFVPQGRQDACPRA